jgi:hypothetical protein
MEEKTAQVSGTRELTDVFDIALPARDGRGLERAVFSAMIDALDPDPETLVQFVQREWMFGVEIGEELLAQRAKAAFDLAAAFGLIRPRMNDEYTELSSGIRNVKETDKHPCFPVSSPVTSR